MSKPRYIKKAKNDNLPPLWLVRSSAMRGGLNPEAESVLAGYDPTQFSNLAYGFRPPIGVYRVSLSRIWPRFRKVLACLKENMISERFQKHSTDAWDEELLQAYEQLLYAFFEHLEDCDNILKSCFNLQNDHCKSPHVKEYWRSIKFYRNRIGMIVNFIKHAQSRLRSVVFYAPDWISLGYYVESVSPDGAPGPDSRLHIGGDTAFSYAWDLRLHLSALYLISRRLADTVKAIMGEPLNTLIEKPGSDDEAAFMARNVSILPRIIYPNEEMLPFPAVVYLEKEFMRELILMTIPPHSGPLPIRGDFTFDAVFKGDGVTQTFNLPYSRYFRSEQI